MVQFGIALYLMFLFFFQMKAIFYPYVQITRPVLGNSDKLRWIHQSLIRKSALSHPILILLLDLHHGQNHAQNQLFLLSFGHLVACWCLRDKYPYKKELFVCVIVRG